MSGYGELSVRMELEKDLEMLLRNTGLVVACRPGLRRIRNNVEKDMSKKILIVI